MKASEIKGIIHDILFLNDWKNPLQRFFIKNKFEIDLISGKIDYFGVEDSLTELYTEIHKWFLKRVKDLKGDLNDFDKAVICVFGKKEKIEIEYKGKKFEKEIVWFDDSIIGKIKKKAKDLEVGEGFKVSGDKIVDD